VSGYFSDASFRFLRQLARHNTRDWFHAHRGDYETHVREPFLRLIGDLQPALAKVSPHFVADPRPRGGSLFQIQRDTRFAADKSPYKTWQGARLFHVRRRELDATPSFYVHIAVDECFIGAGLWHPQPAVQRRVRQFILDNPAGWGQAAHAPAFERRYALDDTEMLKRAPADVAEDFPWRDDLRHHNFVAWRPLDASTVTGPRLRATLARDLAALAPFVDYLCAALDLEF
jgi:uncharacterized protein (TIGR02453 family)